jgi:hypothetical protein
VHTPQPTFLKSSILLLAFLPLFFSCKKGDDSKPVTEPNFTVTGLKDVDFRTISGDSYTFPIDIKSNAGTVDTVFLYANGLPGGMYVDFDPVYGITPFTAKMKVSYYGTEAGVFTIHIKAVGRSGTRTYDVKVTWPDFKGWKLGGDYYHNTGVERDTSTSTNPSIRVNAAGGSQLIFTFAIGAALPTTTRSYTITKSPNAADKMSITLKAPGHTWVSTGSGSNTGTFTFNEGKFTFTCTNVDMADSTQHETLTASFGE